MARFLLLVLWWLPGVVLAQAPAPVPPPVPPALADVPYGTHPRQILDVYVPEAPSDGPRPVVFHIHGGGWVAGSKSPVPGLQAYLDAGLCVVAIQYRYLQEAALAGVQPPVSWPVRDAARALQFVRSRAGEWNLDAERVGATGGSAGACSSLWLAFHADLAEPESEDPVSRQSTRLWAAAVTGAQTSLDPEQLQAWTPNSRYGGHAFGFFDPADLKTRDTRFAEFLAARERVLPWIREYSPYEHVSAGDPPVFLEYRDTPALGEARKDPTHTANYGVPLQERCREVGVECVVQYPGATGVTDPDGVSWLIRRLREAR
jgi:acetyl esterase/lipase